MEILIFEYSSAVLIRVRLNENLKSIFKNDADAFIEMLSYKYNFRMKDIYWMSTEQEEETHELAEELEDEGRFLRICSHCGQLMQSGYYLNGEYACSDECCLALYKGDEEKMKEDLSHVYEECAECYYTEWDSSISD